MNGLMVEKILRFRFYISGTDNPIQILTRPEMPKEFKRKGFTATEWGVILGKAVY